MKKIIYTLAILYPVFLLVSCSGGTESKPDAAVVPVQDSSITAPIIPEPAPAAVEPGNAGQVQTSAQGTNPPHGQPGHRCDIPEGAPLNSPPGNTALPEIPPSAGTPQPVIPTGMPSAETAPGMNPPHGQPGHDCSIPVGSPLKK